MQSSQKNSLLRQGSILAAAGIFVRMIGILYRIPMSNMLGEAGNGIYSVAFGIYSVALTFSSTSLPLAVSKLVSQRTVQKRYKDAYRLFKITMVFSVILGAVFCLGLYFGAGAIENLYARQGLAHPIRVVAPTVFVMSVLAVFRGFFQGKNTMVPTAVSQIVEQIINALISIVAIYFMMKAYQDIPDQAAYGAAGGIMGTLAGAVAALVVLVGVFVLCKSHIKKELVNDHHGHTEAGAAILTALLATMVPILLSQTVYQIGFTIDDLLFGNLMAAKKIDSVVISSLQGVYNTQYALLINAPVAIATAMASSTIPSLAASTARGDYDETRRRTKGVIKFNMALAIPCAVGLAILAEPILALLFPQLTAYRDTASALLLCGSSSVIFYALSTITSAVLQSTNQMRLPVVHGAVALGVHVVLLYLLLQFTNLGVFALVIGHVTFPLVVCVLNWRAVGKHLEYKQEVGKTFIVPLAASAVMAVATLAVYYGALALFKSGAAAVLLSLIAAVGVYGYLILRFRCFSKRELYDLPFGGRIVKAATRLKLY